MKPSKRKPKKKAKPVVRVRRESGLLAPMSAAVKRKISEIIQPRCAYIFPEHGHGHQQCTRQQAHPGAHWCGWKGKQS